MCYFVSLITMLITTGLGITWRFSFVKLVYKLGLSGNVFTKSRPLKAILSPEVATASAPVTEVTPEEVDSDVNWGLFGGIFAAGGVGTVILLLLFL